MDPVEIKRACDQINWKKCAINAVSKSGSTTETLAVFFYVRELLVKAVGRKNHAKHIFITTGDRCNILYKLIDREKYSMITHSDNIGGRWAVGALSWLLLASSAPLVLYVFQIYPEVSGKTDLAFMFSRALISRAKKQRFLIADSCGLEFLPAWGREIPPAAERHEAAGAHRPERPRELPDRLPPRLRRHQLFRASLSLREEY